MAAIDVRALPGGTVIRLIRDEELPEAIWLQIRAIWGADGRSAGTHVDVPLEGFMSRRQSFARRCQELGAEVRLDDTVRGMALLARETRRDLDLTLGEPPTRLSTGELDRLMKQSRFKRELREFQVDDLGRLLELRFGANFSVPGAGKTTVAYATYEIERVRGRLDRMLVIAPLSAFEAWFTEAVECLDPLPEIHIYTSGARIPASAEIVLVNYQRLQQGYPDLADWVRGHKTMVILDEAHRMKRGWNGEWGSACLNLAYLATRREILTGTPAPQAFSDLVALIDFLWPNEARRILPSDALARNPAPDAGQKVAKAIAPLFVRTNKKQLGLPEVTMRSVVVPLENLHRQIYDALRDQYAGQLEMSRRDRLNLTAMGQVTMYLLEAATNPKLLVAGSKEGDDSDAFRHPPLAIPPGSRLAELIERYNLYETPSKFQELARIIKVNAALGRKTLIWTNFVRNFSVLEDMLRRHRPALIHGRVPPRSANPEDITRVTEIARFRHDDSCMVLIANPAAMSEGISLHHECHDAIYLERTFNAGQYLQSLDRIHRLGLAEGQETRVTFLLSAGTIDETVDRRIAIKARRLGEILSDPGLVTLALPDEEDYGPPIDSIDDVEALFAHLRGDDEP